MKVERIVNVDVVLIVHCERYLVSAKGITFHVLLFQDKLHNSDILKSVIRKIMSTLSRQYQFMDSIIMQTVRGTVSITG